jgi:4'-phosphopantetheinyl transferase
MVNGEWRMSRSPFTVHRLPFTIPMIHWLMQSHSAHPNLARGIPPVGLLSDVEWERWENLTTEKRKRDWLCGRWTAKLLLQNLYREKTGYTIPGDSFSIINNAGGVPLVTGHWSLATGYSLSISHSHGYALCAVAEHPHYSIGADLERIEERVDGFVEDYFTAGERERVACCVLRNQANTHHAIRNTLINATWSAKEAVLKALHLGLSVDTRTVECLIEPFVEPPTCWTPFTIQCDNNRLPHPAPKLKGWWQVQGDFVLTVAMGKVAGDEESRHEKESSALGMSGSNRTGGIVSAEYGYPGPQQPQPAHPFPGDRPSIR